MAEQYLINDTTLTSIADAIREKWDTEQAVETKYLPKEMPRAIRGLYGGEKVEIDELISRDNSNVTCIWDTKGSISYIRSYAFASQDVREYLTIVSFPSCTYIGRSAFYGCCSHMSIYLLGSSIPELGDTADNVFPSYATIYVPESMVDAYIASGFGVSAYGGVNNRLIEAFNSSVFLTPSEVLEIVRAHEGT